MRAFIESAIIEDKSVIIELEKCDYKTLVGKSVIIESTRNLKFSRMDFEM